MMKNYIGTSGWSYGNWKEVFYPKDLRQTEWLAFFAKNLNSVEINSTFYASPRISTIDKWYNTTPANFVFSIKAPQEITHNKRLVACENELSFFLSDVERLGEKCGPILLQLPASFTLDLDVLTEFLDILPTTHRFTIEFRSKTWWRDEVYKLLRAKNIAFCIYEFPNAQSPKVVTADFIYVRLHGASGLYMGKYEDKVLTSWKNWLEEQKKDVFFYFNNTRISDDALQNAKKLSELLAF
ncbi:MAG: hypothetical protein K0R02_542 [Rickettsiaceae bacterium]|nr:hypothetical protein [Rickettsiaceae bacterium]